MQSFQAYILYVNETTKGKRMDEQKTIKMAL